MRTRTLARAMADIGAGLLALPLADLPAIASVRLMPEWPDSLDVQLQLSVEGSADDVAGLLAWADAMTDPVAVGREREDHIKLEVSGVIGGFRVAVWAHLAGPDLVDAGCFLSLPPDGGTHRLPLGVLRALAQHRKVAGSDG